MSKSSKANAKEKLVEDQRENTLQGVVLANFSEHRFAPFTQEKPQCLLPVANIPMIEYTLEFLAGSGVSEIFVYSGSNEERVEEYLKNSRWMSPSSTLPKVTTILCCPTSVGDALRDLDKRDIITGDFLVVSGDVISNLDTSTALAQHRNRRAADKNAIMTMVLRQTGKYHRTTSSSRKPFFFVDPSHDRCIHYEEIFPNKQGTDRRFHIESDLLSRPEIDIRGDLLDCEIDICTPETLGLWSENFDYSTRSSFLRGVLQDYELNGKTIHTYIPSEGYAARISSLRAYVAVSQDIIDRWTFPFTPDCNLFPGHNYRLMKDKVYLDSVVIARESSIKSRSLVGKSTSIGIQSIINNSIIGQRCQIGKNVKIEDCYIWDDVVIGDNSSIAGSLVADGTKIGSDCSIGAGSILSFQVQISNQTKLPPKSRITSMGNDLIGKGLPASTAPRTPTKSVGHSTASDSDLSDGLFSRKERRLSVESFESVSTLHSGEYNDLDSDEGSQPLQSGSLTNVSHTDTDFFEQVVTSTQDGILKGDDPGNVRLEVLGLRLAQNASDTIMRDGIVRALIRSIFAFIRPQGKTGSGSIAESSRSSSFSNTIDGSRLSALVINPLSPKEATSKVFKTYSPVLQLGLSETSTTKKEDQVSVLQEIEKECTLQASNDLKTSQEVLLFSLNILHQELEVLQDDSVLQWWTGRTDAEDDSSVTQEDVKQHETNVRTLAATYVNFLLEENSDEDSDEETDEETDEESDE